MRKFALFTLVLFLDFCTKYWIVHHLPLMQLYGGYPFGGIGIFQTVPFTLSIVHTINTGTAWGLFSNYQMLLLILRILITAALLVYLCIFKPAKFFQLPLLFVAAGAMGNILDYFLYGHVVDMIYCVFYKYSYPIFNIADSAIFCSVAYLLFFSKKKPRHVPT